MEGRVAQPFARRAKISPRDAIPLACLFFSSAVHSHVSYWKNTHGRLGFFPVGWFPSAYPSASTGKGPEFGNPGIVILEFKSLVQYS